MDLQGDWSRIANKQPGIRRVNLFIVTDRFAAQIEPKAIAA